MEPFGWHTKEIIIKYREYIKNQSQVWTSHLYSCSVWKQKKQKLDTWLYDKELLNKISNYRINEFSNINSDHKPDISFHRKLLKR